MSAFLKYPGFREKAVTLSYDDGVRFDIPLARIIEKYGMLYFVEKDFTTTAEHKQSLKKLVFEQKQLPEFSGNVAGVSYADGCKVTFEDGSWVICRFSGTEPLLRLAAEGNTEAQARDYIQRWKSFLEL